MEKITVKDSYELYQMMTDYVGDNEPALIASYETVCEVLRYFIMDEYDIASIEISRPDFDGYDDAYLLETYDGNVYVERAMRSDENGYLIIDSPVIIQDAYVAKYLKNNSAKDMMIFRYEENGTGCLLLDDEGTGFIYYSHDGNYIERFQYKGNSKLTENDAWKLVHKYCI